MSVPGTVTNQILPLYIGGRYQRTTRQISDISIGYSQNTGELSIYGIDAINNMIENILTTSPGDRAFEPEFGSEMPTLLFEPCDEQTAWQMEVAIFDALKRWMPYINVILQRTYLLPIPHEAAFDCTITYELKIGGVVSNYRAKFFQ